MGPVRNFEFATRLATGEYIAFCDQDDIWLPEKIEKLYNSIGDHWLVYCDSVLINEDGQSLQKNLSQLRKMESTGDSRGFIFSNVVWGHAMLINKRLLSHVLPIPADIPHDIWFAVKATTLTGIKYLNIPLTLYRQHPQTVTTTISKKAVTRKNEIRFKDFEDKLFWIASLRNNTSEARKPFYDELYRLYAEKAKGRFARALFFFMLKHQAVLFQFTYKSLASRIIEIRKQCRGEKK